MINCNQPLSHAVTRSQLHII